MGTPKIFPRFFAIIFPAENGGVGEEHNADRNDPASRCADMCGKSSHSQFYTCQRFSVRPDGSQNAGRCNGKSGNGANNDGVDESPRHRNISLPCRIISSGRSGGNSGRTEAGFIGKTAAGHAEADRIHHGNGYRTDYTAFHSSRIKSHHKNEVQSVRYVFKIQRDTEEPRSNVENCHSGNDEGRYSGNGSNPSDNDRQCENRKDDTYNFIGKAESGTHRRGDGIGLGHIPDPKRSDDSKHGKQKAHTESCSFIFKPVLHGKHGAALHFPFRIHFAELKAKHTFRKLGRQAEAGGNPHPYQSARTAGKHGGRHAHDISRADGRGKRRHQRGKRRNISRSPICFTGLPGEHAFHCIRQIAPCTEIQVCRKVNSCTHEQTQHHRPPDKAVNVPHNLIHCRHIHFVSPFTFSNILSTTKPPHSSLI